MTQSHSLLVMKKGFNFSEDGPGNRLVYHLQGCNLRCLWCANPESFLLEGTEIMSSGRRQLSCQSYPIEELYKEALDSKNLFFDNGGVTFSGGEPTLQFVPLKALLQKLTQHKIHTVIETNGTHPALTELDEVINYLILDFKHIDTQKHLNFTGGDNEIILQNITHLLSFDRPLLLRIPLINGFNADQHTITAMAKWLHKRQKNTLVTYEFLPYHEYGRNKWEACGLDYPFDHGYIRKDFYSFCTKTFSQEGLTVIKT